MQTDHLHSVGCQQLGSLLLNSERVGVCLTFFAKCLHPFQGDIWHANRSSHRLGLLHHLRITMTGGQERLRQSSFLAHADH